MADVGLAVPMADLLIEEWTEHAKSRAPVDTGQLKARTTITGLTGNGTTATATNQSDVPYAGFVEYGTRHMAAQPYFRPGMEHAKRVAEAAGGKIGTQIARNIESGGVWNPKGLF